MIPVIKYPNKDTYQELLQRPSADNEAIQQKVLGIMQTVRAQGDKAIRMLTKQIDGIALDNLSVSEEEYNNIEEPTEALKAAIDNAIQNIRTFHEAQKQDIVKIETQQGITCWRKSVALEKVGLYIPGGTAPLFSTLLMLAIPAQIAGCKEIIICTPPDKKGSVNATILYVARTLGIKSIYKVGGAQAIAAMTYGTETIPQVYKIFGPGNKYVTAAKQVANSTGTPIDMPAGPSEVAILADESCVPEYVASDLLSQAEHGTDSQVLLVCTNEEMISKIDEHITAQLEELPRKDIAKQALANSKAILVENMVQGIKLINEYAPEHLIIASKDEEAIAEQVINAGSVFLGNYSPESAGDYASGTNHTLPTNGFAKSYSGVSLDSFIKKITFQKLTQSGLNNIADTIIEMATAEGLDAHANAIKIRTKQ